MLAPEKQSQPGGAGNADSGARTAPLQGNHSTPEVEADALLKAVELIDQVSQLDWREWPTPRALQFQMVRLATVFGVCASKRGLMRDCAEWLAHELEMLAADLRIEGQRPVEDPEVNQ